MLALFLLALLCEAEIGEPYVAVGVEQDVLGLQVSVHNVQGVQME